MKITAFKSEHTGELFETEEEYTEHMRKIEAGEERKKEGERKSELLHYPRLTATSILDFQDKALSVINEVYASRLTLKSLNISFESILHEIRMSWNCCPVSLSHFPTYSGISLGWRVHCVYIFKQFISNSKIQEFPRLPGINVGRIENDDKYIYHFKGNLFLEDFPFMQKQYELYSELQKKEEEWEFYLENLFQEESKKCLILSQCNNDIGTYTSEMTRFHSLLNTTVERKNDRENRIREQLLSSHPFAELAEMEKLGKEFMFS